MTTTDTTIRVVDWQTESAALRRIREAVFIYEQNVPEALEWDGLDEQATHFLASVSRAPVGTARLLPDGHIGRVAVLNAYRKRGVGRQIMATAIEYARKHGYRELVLHAQIHAVPFYEQLGFSSYGGEFMEAGIPHQAMRLILNPH